ncbi:putative LRR receptor-like serine/threonine-protein kinase [Tetrabaena socialis]|uniref:Putative LRR receptor-like serine/threonine-protein kinase n=1 Tax=Tetrabaena socialis TaxID=47790 RepID=A0A2J8A941_9CHLO|nr:putative LRR receptor-like serine/threonine-protein kinase [Tetrabaena socialis]|eukprot:PNH09030.1 putative LRR receptor-like serine/threonine-protein kinase [Tetrabaena socialis]
MAAARGWLLAAVALLAAAVLQHRAFARTLERDVYALIALHEEVRARDPQWAGVMDKWPVQTCAPDGTCGVDPCGLEWEGDGWEGISCRYQWDWDKSIPRVVTNFHLPKYGLTGTLPRSLALLANLTELDMDANQLIGPLPAEWGCLGNLIEIDFSNNRLTGTIPPEWGLLRGLVELTGWLVELEVDGNPGLSGCVPDGCPPFDRLCGRYPGPPCPSFTNDAFIGTAVGGTRIGTRCAPPEGGDQTLQAWLRCPVVADFRQPILGFFKQQQQKGRGSGGDAAAAATNVVPAAAAPKDNGLGAASMVVRPALGEPAK